MHCYGKSLADEGEQCYSVSIVENSYINTYIHTYIPHNQADLDEVRMSCSLLHETNTDLIFRDTVRGSLVVGDAAAASAAATARTSSLGDYIFPLVCIHYVCMYVCMYVVSIFSVSMFTCMYVCMYVCM